MQASIQPPRPHFRPPARPAMGAQQSRPLDIEAHKRREESLMADWGTPPPWPVWNVAGALGAPPPPTMR
jgi:hypothetical protein